MRWHTMRVTRIVGGLVLASVVSLYSVSAQTTPSPTPVTPSQVQRAPGQAAPPQPSGFETPPLLRAQDMLPPALVKGPHYHVNEAVFTYGFMNGYKLQSDFGTFEVLGDEMLRIRTQEILALAALDEISKTKEFANAAEKAATSPIRFAKNAILNPVDTVTGVPKGLWRYVKRVGGVIGGGRGEFEESGMKEVIGFSGLKRQYAFALDVDVYSSNKVLQKSLNKVSWAAYAGGMTITVGMLFIPNPAGLVVRATGTSKRLNTLLRDTAPEELRRYNRRTLRQAGYDNKLTKAFIRHRWLSPRHKTYIADALSELSGVENRDVFLEAVVSAASEEDALFFQRVAEMMQGYHDRVAPMQQMLVVGGLLGFYATNNALVLPLVLDYGSWTELGSVLTHNFAQFRVPGREITQRELWLTGRLSERAKHEVTARGIVVHEQSFETLQPPPEPEAK